jgi:hypothetical protein
MSKFTEFYSKTRLGMALLLVCGLHGVTPEPADPAMGAQATGLEAAALSSQAISLPIRHFGHRPYVSSFLVYELSPRTVHVAGKNMVSNQQTIKVFFQDQFLPEQAIATKGAHAFMVRLPGAFNEQTPFYVQFEPVDADAEEEPQHWIPFSGEDQPDEDLVRRYRAMAVGEADLPAPSPGQGAQDSSPYAPEEEEAASLFAMEFEDHSDTVETSLPSQAGSASSSSSPAPWRPHTPSVSLPRALHVQAPGLFRPSSCPPVPGPQALRVLTSSVALGWDTGAR